MSTLAAFLAVAGGSVAVASVARDEVKSRHVENNALRSADLRNDGGVGGVDVADGSLTGADVGANSLTGQQINESSLGQVPDAARLEGQSSGAFELRRSDSDHSSVLGGPSIGSQTLVAVTEVTVPRQSRILASASAVIGNDADDATICWLNAGGDPNNVANDISQRVFSDTPNGAFDFQAFGVNGSVVRGAGTHTIRFYCGVSNSDPTIDRVDLLAWSVAP